MSLGNYFRFDAETGEWRNIVVGDRFVFLGEPFILNMIINLSKQFGSAAGVFIYQSGLGIGAGNGETDPECP